MGCLGIFTPLASDGCPSTFAWPLPKDSALPIQPIETRCITSPTLSAYRSLNQLIYNYKRLGTRKPAKPQAMRVRDSGILVGGTGFEPVTPAVRSQCSTRELTAPRR